MEELLPFEKIQREVFIKNEGLLFLNLVNEIKNIRRMCMDEKLPFERIQRKLFVKKETETNWDYGQNPEKRRVNELINYGIINLNKPEGPS